MATEIPANPKFIDFETLTPHIHDLHKKQAVTVQSLRKVEEGQLIPCLISFPDSYLFQPHTRS